MSTREQVEFNIGALMAPILPSSVIKGAEIPASGEMQVTLSEATQGNLIVQLAGLPAGTIIRLMVEYPTSRSEP